MSGVPRILLVEDSEGYRLLVRTVLEDLEVVEAGTVREALSHDPSTIDAVLCDLGLPDADGDEAPRRLSAAFRGIPVIALTGAAGDAQTAALMAGASAVVAKGGELDGTLLAAVGDALGAPPAQEGDRVADDPELPRPAAEHKPLGWSDRAALVAVVLALLAAAAWAAGSALPGRWWVDAEAMGPWSAEALVFLATSVLLRHHRRGRLWCVPAAAATAVGLVFAAEWLTGRSFGIDASLGAWGGSAYPGRPSVTAALTFAALGGALLATRCRPIRGVRPADALLLLAAAVLVLAWAGLLQDADALTAAGRPVAVAAPLLVALTAIVVALAADDEEAGIAALLRDRGEGGRMARRLLPAAVAAVPVLAAVCQAGNELGVWDPAFERALLTTVAVVAGWLFVLRLGRETTVRARAQSAAEDELRAREREWRTLMSSAPVGIFQTDADGRCTYLNPRYLEITGLSEEQALGEGWAEAVHPVDRRDVLEAWRAAAHTMEPVVAQMRFRRPDATVVHVTVNADPVLDPDGTVRSWTGVLVDVTAQRRAERDAAVARGRLQAIIDQAPSRIALRDLAGRFLVVNAPYAATYGAKPEALLGRRAVEVLPAEAADRVLAYDASILATGKAMDVQEVLEGKDGSERTFLSARFAVADDAGVMVGVGVVSTDISERRDLERRLARRAEELDSAQALAHVGSWRWDALKGGFAVSAELRRILGVPVEQQLHSLSSVLPGTHPADRIKVQAAASRAAAELGSFVIAHRIVRPGGEARHVRVIGRATRDESGWPCLVGTMQDVTEQEERERAVRRAEGLLRSVVDRAPIGLGVIGADGRWQQANPALARLLCRGAADLCGRPLEEVVAPRDRDVDAEQRRRLLAGDLPAYEVSVGVLRPDGSAVPVVLSFAAVAEAGGPPEQVVVQALDLTERRAVEDRLRWLAASDPLTGTANRRQFGEALQRAVAAADRGGPAPGLLLVDLDGFKDVNDRHGHAAGDAVLQTVARALDDSTRETDLVARLGGDEFAVLASMPDPEALVAMGEKLRVAIATAATRMGFPGVRASVGASVLGPDDGQDELLHKTDTALYEAKRAGRDRTVLHIASAVQA